MKSFEADPGALIIQSVIFFQCVKSKSVTNLAEATADPALELDAGGNPINPSSADAQGREEPSAGPFPHLGVQPDQPSQDDQH